MVAQLTVGGCSRASSDVRGRTTELMCFERSTTHFTGVCHGVQLGAISVLWTCYRVVGGFELRKHAMTFLFLTAPVFFHMQTSHRGNVKLVRGSFVCPAQIVKALVDTKVILTEYAREPSQEELVKSF